MHIIDLSTPIYDGMPVFTGDPDVAVKEIYRESWYLSQLTLTTHDGTHVNVPAHIKKGNKTLSDYTLDHFCGDAVLYENDADLQEGVGVVFDVEHDCTMEIAKRAVEANVKFVALANEFDLEAERYTLEHGLISYERLVNTDQLSKQFQFFGMPLPIREGDGSPVRAFAIV